MGKLTYFLGLQVYYKTNGDIFVNQSKYIKYLINKAGMDSCKPATTPCKPHQQLLDAEGTVLTDPTLYRSIVSSLQYLTFIRLDIMYAVNSVCQFIPSPTELHFTSVKRILRYLQGIAQHEILYSSGTMLDLNVFPDSDWVADLNTRRSLAGYVVFLGNNPISW
ncbi:uncharacterized mitochondrial protein AtMg00810-like [Pyrus communis]|uniref:uncharacterized mitochondrial protein AtMg00810-like n=1 Tax=Pyrus communis TaxID=23211 RepID=UPI0035C0AAFD